MLSYIHCPTLCEGPTAGEAPGLAVVPVGAPVMTKVYRQKYCNEYYTL